MKKERYGQGVLIKQERDWRVGRGPIENREDDRKG
jgi:hypothetical protein